MEHGFQKTLNEQKTEKLAHEASKVELVMNKRKTKVIAVKPTEDIRIVFEGKVIEEVEWFEYLGSTVSNDGDVRKEVGIRTGKAGAVFSKMRKVWTSRGIALKTKF